MEANKLLQKALEVRASDLHITAGMPPVIRLNGALTKMDLPKLSREDTERICKELLSTEKFGIFTAKGEVDTAYVIPEVGLFRVNCYRQRGTTAIAVRILNDRVFTLEELELPDILAKLAMFDKGLILVTGPTGSGKSTTLAAMTNIINTNKEVHIITLEDPIEYFHKHKKSIISQREIGRDSENFPSALRSALRQDPDVIVVGEMRDLETIAIAVTAAETGHLVLATLHTNDAAQTVERVVDSFPYSQQQQIRIQLSNSLKGVISQQLIRRSNGNGRIAAVEVLLSNSAVRNLIREGKVHQLPSIMQINSKHGMQTMDKHLQTLCESKMINKDDALRYSADKERMSHFLKI